MIEVHDFRIIVIDDNPAIHYDFIKILKTESFDELEKIGQELFAKGGETVLSLPKFEIEVASQGQEGVEKIKEAIAKNRPFSLAFVDIRMPPGWDGIKTIQKIWEIDKNIQVVICTAFSDYSWEETIASLGQTDNLLILKKPFDNISVRQLACALTTKWELAEKTRSYTELLKQQVATKTLSLEKSLSLVKSTFESSSDGIILIDGKGVITDYNAKIIEMLEIPDKVLDSKQESSFIEFIHEHSLPSENYHEKYTELKAHPDHTSIDVIHFKNGKIFECYTQPHKLDNQIIGRILDFRDITQRATLEQELAYQATHDPLTDLVNRVKLNTELNTAIQEAHQNSTKFAVLFLDLDRFKLINDSLSHAVGDDVLKEAARRLKAIVGPQDVVARLGGDEFVVLLKGLKEDHDLNLKLTQVLTTFRQRFNIPPREVTLTASIGVALFPKDGETTDALLANADVAMYRAKANKGDNFKLFSTEMSKETLSVLDREIELRRALTNNELFLCYQPQIDSSTQKMTAVEVLLRWRHPTQGVLLPIDFIPLAEETGLIVPIGEWVLRVACAQNKAWQDAGLAPIRIAVNISAQQCQQYDLTTKVANILAETGLNPKYLEIELTETIILGNPGIIRIVTDLKKIGVILSIDDFGTGYSCLSYLDKIPLDRLKIDKSFIQRIQSNTDDEVIIRAVISMAKNLNLAVLAEGVETEDQMNFLKKCECNDLQGFYFSKPLTTDEMEGYLNRPQDLEELLLQTTKDKK